jgi:hypothetical protein
VSSAVFTTRPNGHLGYVALDKLRRSALAGDLFRHTLATIDIDVVDDHLRAFEREALGNALAEP